MCGWIQRQECGVGAHNVFCYSDKANSVRAVISPHVHVAQSGVSVRLPIRFSNGANKRRSRSYRRGFLAESFRRTGPGTACQHNADQYTDQDAAHSHGREDITDVRKLTSAALFVLLAASARTWAVPAYFFGMDWRDLLAVIDLGHKIYFSPRWAAERKGRLAIVVRY